MYYQDIPTIDLHGIADMHTALATLDRELYRYYQEGEHQLRIIYGIGTGTLASMVQASLDANPMVHKWTHESSGGSCVVLL